MKEYNKYTKPIMDEFNKKFKYLTKLNDTSWLVQSNPKSCCEAFFVNTLRNGHIIMSGDYGGIMVRPYGNEDCLPNWMAGATTLSYFAEKVHIANQYHKRKEYCEKIAKENIEEIKEYFIENLDEEDKTVKETEFDDLVQHKSLECEHEYWTLIHDLEHEFDLCDLYEYDPTEYTHQLKWQHKCLVFWGNKVLEDAFVEKKKAEE